MVRAKLRGDAMPKYAIMFHYRPGAVRAMMDRPEDRAAIVGRAAESVGGRLEAYYWALGSFDGLIILEVPNGRAAASVQMVMAGTGAVDHVETHELFPAEGLNELLQRAKSVPYSPPGG
jgi:uncharacterized protein with GYD domain